MELIKKLRSQTGAGMVDCQKALKEAEGDFEKAVDILRKKGIAKASKREGRDTSEGIVKLAVNADKNEGYMLELNSETDFVARNEQFAMLADSILEVIESNKPADLDALMALPVKDLSVSDTVSNLSGTIGEKMELRRFTILSGETVAGYTHQGGRIGVLIALDTPGQEELAIDVAMHIAAANPQYLKPEDVDSEEVEREKEVYKEQLIKEGKPEAIMDKIITGKMARYYSEICLLEQEYIKDDKKKVKDILGEVNITGFARFSL